MNKEEKEIGQEKLDDNNLFQKEEDELLNDMLNIAKHNTEYQIQKKQPIKIMIVVGLFLIMLMVLLIISKAVVKPQEFVDKTKDPSVTIEEMYEETYEEYDEWDFEYPANVPTWSKQVFNEYSILEKDEMYQSLIDFSKKYHDLIVATSIIPSEEGGDWESAPPIYTNDIGKRQTPDGKDNELFSYTLKEDYLIAYARYIQELINPVFGDWVFAQRYTPLKPLKNNADLNILKDLFDESWWTTNIIENEDYSALPILVDWDGDDFGGLEFAERIDGRYGTWYGVVNVDEENPVTVENLGRDERNSHVLKINTPVKYSAFSSNDDVLEKTGVLEMTLGSNSQDYLINRVVIIDAKLILN